VRFTDVGANTDNTTVITAATITLSTRAAQPILADRQGRPNPATAKSAMISRDTSSSVGPRPATGKHHQRAR
jgi:hypothetical protein